VRGWLTVALFLLGSLVSVNGLRQFFIEPLTSPSVNAIWFCVQILPLAAVVPGMLRLQPGSVFGAALVSLLYFVHGVLLAATPELRVMGIFEAVVSVALLCVATYMTRSLRTPK
jgi:uncharacterized membrane protein